MSNNSRQVIACHMILKYEKMIPIVFGTYLKLRKSEYFLNPKFLLTQNFCMTKKSESNHSRFFVRWIEHITFETPMLKKYCRWLAKKFQLVFRWAKIIMSLLDQVRKERHKMIFKRNRTTKFKLLCPWKEFIDFFCFLWINLFYVEWNSFFHYCHYVIELCVSVK